MSIEALAMVLNHSTASGTDKLVLLGIANHEGDGGSWPSIKTLARYANVEERSAQRAIGRLIASGELEIIGHQRGNPYARGGHHTNLYRVLVSCPAGCDGTTYHRMPGVTPTTPLDLSPGVTSGADEGCRPGRRRVTSTTPKTSLNHPKNHPPRAAAPDDSTSEATNLEWWIHLTFTIIARAIYDRAPEQCRTTAESYQRWLADDRRKKHVDQAIALMQGGLTAVATAGRIHGDKSETREAARALGIQLTDEDYL